MNNINRSKETLANISLHVVVYIIFLLFIFPYLYMVLSSFKSQLDLMQYPPSWLFIPTLDNYRKVIFDKNFFFYAKNSAVVAVVNTIIAFMLAIPAAFALAKSKQKKRGLWIYLILLLQMVPPIGVVITFFIIAQTLRIIDTLLSLILFELLWTTPLAIWLLRGYFLNFPNELIESARIDGYSLYGILFKIVIPLTAPGILATSIFVFIRVWNHFVLAFFISVMRARSLPTTIHFFLVYTQI